MSVAPSPGAKNIKRRAVDDSQRLRSIVQWAFVALNVWIGIQFYIWVVSLERGVTPAVARPAGVDGWLPIAGLLNLKSWIVSGEAPVVHPAAAVLLFAFILISLLLKKAFCSWLCPIGTVSEQLWKIGKRLFGENLNVPKWVDIPLRGIKYLLFAFFGWIALQMSAADVRSFMETPYGVIADVKLLNFFRFMGLTGVTVMVMLVILSLFIRNFWCRYLCPYGALLGIVALLSPAAIRRDPESCIDCTKCAKACPARLPVDRIAKVRSVECTLCMTCVSVCPVAGALEVKVSRRHRVPAWAIAALIAMIFSGAVMTARMSGHWETSLPHEVYAYLVARASDVSH